MLTRLVTIQLPHPQLLILVLLALGICVLLYILRSYTLFSLFSNARFPYIELSSYEQTTEQDGVDSKEAYGEIGALNWRQWGWRSGWMKWGTSERELPVSVPGSLAALHESGLSGATMASHLDVLPPDVKAMRRVGPLFAAPRPAMYDTSEPLSMAKAIMGRHAHRRPSLLAPPRSSAPHLRLPSL